MTLLRTTFALGAFVLTTVVACDARSRTPTRDTRRAPVPAPGGRSADAYPMLDSLTLVADDVAVSVIDSTGLGGVVMQRPEWHVMDRRRRRPSLHVGASN
jgi:hypothetical protein